MAQVVTRETLIQELEGLAEEQIPEVLDFIRFLKSREDKPSLTASRRPAPDMAALRILSGTGPHPGGNGGPLRYLSG